MGAPVDTEEVHGDAQEHARMPLERCVQSTTSLCSYTVGHAFCLLTSPCFTGVSAYPLLWRRRVSSTTYSACGFNIFLWCMPCRSRELEQEEEEEPYDSPEPTLTQPLAQPLAQPSGVAPESSGAPSSPPSIHPTRIFSLADRERRERKPKKQVFKVNSSNNSTPYTACEGITPARVQGRHLKPSAARCNMRRCQPYASCHSQPTPELGLVPPIHDMGVVAHVVTALSAASLTFLPGGREASTAAAS